MGAVTGTDAQGTKIGSDNFEPMMTLYLTHQTTPDDIRAAAAGVCARACVCTDVCASICSLTARTEFATAREHASIVHLDHALHG
jgi:dihydroorotase